MVSFPLGYDVNWEDETDTITCPHTLSHKAAVDEEVSTYHWKILMKVIEKGSMNVGIGQ